MRPPTALTLVRSRPWQYQTTYWNDGTARWDGISGTRLGAWHAAVDPTWFDRVSRLAVNLGTSRKRSGGDLTLIVERGSKSKAYTALEGREMEDQWTVAMLMDGMATCTMWAPLDTTGLADFSPWVTGTSVFFSQRNCNAHALALPEGLVVLAGSQLATSTAPSLEETYKAERAVLQDHGDIILNGDRFFLARHLHFRRPSAAASVISGSNTNGRQAWRDGAGHTWADLGWDD